ncbi:MAG: hypothetical protein A3E36_03505 [Candidatus Andersenbacteria bacterium RIFCSPHIGHO2_12_FULL_45_11b]|uniref:Helix-turn-helix domain-containing protein n=1 Tax=Candidatus Andersenbacteria bacterium RIFCSPHIGHO2_12_FULL_45_11b TaxID=1797282 RepID=A0A1G1X910_9BACT|nr:MAG: hypothetical protein A3E36_03505 [Candidatus Andersenbacteria bacterium RIFCSPHIGHO2_12_FULL_45_11b]
MRTIFTTGEVAKICNVSTGTVVRWFKNMGLRGYTIPGGSHRRIPREYLIRFLKENGMPFQELENEGMNKVLLVTLDTSVHSALERLLPQGDYRVKSVRSIFEAGMCFEELGSDCVVIDYEIGYFQATKVAHHLRQQESFADCMWVAILRDADIEQGFIPEWLDATFKRPFDLVLLAHCIRTLIARKKQLA